MPRIKGPLCVWPMLQLEATIDKCVDALKPIAAKYFTGELNREELYLASDELLRSLRVP